MHEGFILSIDQGTTSSRCILFNRNAEIVSSAQQEIKSFFPQEGFVEQDPMEIYSSVRETFLECIEKSSISVNQISAIGIANQRETTLVWDRKNGIPIYPAIVWQSKQSLQIIEEWKRSGFEPLIIEKTGLVADAYFSAGKLAWILNHVPMRAQKQSRENWPSEPLTHGCFG
jgi:glycerol kinase